MAPKKERELSEAEVKALGLDQHELTDEEISALEAQEGQPHDGHGASGGWGYPDPGLPKSLLAKFVQGGTKDSSDEGIGLAARAFGIPVSRAVDAEREPGVTLSYRQGPVHGQYLRLPDGSEAPMETEGDMQRGARDYVRQIQEGADEHHKYPGMAAQMLGEGLSDFAIAGQKMLAPTYQTAAGTFRGLMGNKTADLTRPWTPAALEDAGISTALGGVIGYGTSMLPSALKAAGESEVAQSLAGTSAGQKLLGLLGDAAQAPGRALEYAGDKAKDLGGWLKVKSLHPVPMLSKAMRDLPGGAPAVGRELLDRGVGGFTKGGTAEQAATAFKEASGAIDELASAHDSGGGAPIDISKALAAGRAEAQNLMSRPPTKNVGKQMMDIVEGYEQKFSEGSGTAQDVLEMKRDLGDAAYGENEKLRMAKDRIAGKLGRGLSKFERATDDALDQTLGPQFEAANLTSRRLRGASQAAEHAAGRQLSNNHIDLKSWLAALAAGGAGHLGHLATPEAAAAGLGTLVLGKYGNQAAARSAYLLGDALQSPMRNLAAPITQELIDRPGVWDALRKYRPSLTQELAASRDGRDPVAAAP